MDKLKRYDVGYDRLGDDMVSEDGGGGYVRFADVEEFLRELIAMAEKAKNDFESNRGNDYLYGRHHQADEAGHRARALLGEG